MSRSKYFVRVELLYGQDFTAGESKNTETIYRFCRDAVAAAIRWSRKRKVKNCEVWRTRSNSTSAGQPILQFKNGVKTNWR